MTPGTTRPSGPDAQRDERHGESLELTVGRLLTGATWTGVGLIGSGVALMLLQDVSPLAAMPVLTPGSVLAALLALRPEGPLAIGLVVLVASPALRVVGALVGYGRDGERRMVAISIAILAVLVISIAVGLGATP